MRVIRLKTQDTGRKTLNRRWKRIFFILGLVSPIIYISVFEGENVNLDLRKVMKVQ
jgi:hypothetical protein